MHRRSFIKLITGALAAIPVLGSAKPSNEGDLMERERLIEKIEFMELCEEVAHRHIKRLDSFIAANGLPAQPLIYEEG
jgi:hypothetical protein